MKKGRLLNFIIVCIFLISLGSISLATSVDVVPPNCSFTIENATLSDGIYYTDNTTLNLNISASDKITNESDLKMLVSIGPATINASTAWENYSTIKSISVTGNSMDIYLYVKDAAGNISPSVKTVLTEYTITYSADGASNVPGAETAYYGRPFNITVQEPTMSDKYFYGWSETSGATTATWKSDETIPTDQITGNKTLYAVWGDEARPIAEVVEIGDFVNYPVEYTNVATGSTIDGWRVLSIENGIVKLISAGTPLTYTNTNSTTAITDLTTNFKTATYASNGFGEDLTSAFSNMHTTNVTSVQESDVLNVTGLTSLSGKDISNYAGTIDNGTSYFIPGTSTLYNVNASSDTIGASLTTTFGVRPVVTLADTTLITGRGIDGKWIIGIPETAYAIYSDDDKSLTFYKTNEIIAEGSTYNGLTVTNAYFGFEDATYTSAASVPWNEISTNVTSVSFEDQITPASTAYWFSGFNNTTKFTVTNLNTSNVTNMQSMFEDAGRDATTLEFVGINSFDTSNVTNMQSTFDCIGFDTPEVSLDISNWDTQNVTDMSYMFRSAGYGASTLDLKLSNLNTSKLESAYMMFSFAGQDALTWSIGDLSTKTVTRTDGTTYTAWDVSKVENMHAMFMQAGMAATMWDIGDLSGWTTTNLTELNFTFNGAAKYAENEIVLDLSNFNTSKITSFEYLFSDFGPQSNGSVKMNLSSWDTSSITNMDMMFGMYKLVEITLGEKFSFNGSGTTRLTDLPTPSSTYITGADGKWYNTTTGVGYAPADVPNNTAATYTAISTLTECACVACKEAILGEYCSICTESCEHTEVLGTCRAHCPVFGTGEHDTSSDLCACCGIEIETGYGVNGYCATCTHYSECETHTPKCTYHCEWLHCACDGCTETLTYTAKENDLGEFVEYSIDGIETPTGNYCYTCDTLCELHNNYCETHCPEEHTTTYTVQHWQQTLTGGTEQNSTNYTAYEEEEFTGEIGGSVTPAVNTYTGFTSPSTQTVTIVEDGSTVVNYYYTRNSYTITITQSANGTITPTSASVRYGGSQTFTITPSSSSYKITAIKVDGSNITITNDASMTYTFSNVNSTHTITATFALRNQAPNTPTITATSKTTNSVTFTITGDDPDGDSLTYTITMIPTSGTTKTFTTTSKTCTATGLDEYTTYSYYVTATDGSSASTTSTTNSVLTMCSGTTYTDGLWCYGAKCNSCGHYHYGDTCTETETYTCTIYTEEVDCPNCVGGEVECTSCNGDGYVLCSDPSCSLCAGSGYYDSDCIDCEEGTVLGHSYTTTTVTCGCGTEHEVEECSNCSYFSGYYCDSCGEEGVPEAGDDNCGTSCDTCGGSGWDYIDEPCTVECPTTEDCGNCSGGTITQDCSICGGYGEYEEECGCTSTNATACSHSQYSGHAYCDTHNATTLSYQTQPHCKHGNTSEHE